MNSNNYDVVIVGSGFGGSAAAYSLSKAGYTVLLLEKGGWAKRDDLDWDAKEILINRRYKSSYPTYVKQFEDEDYKPVYHNEVVGGNSIFYGGASLRLREKDFERWPIKYDDLEYYYSLAEHLLEVSGEADTDPFQPHRSSDYLYRSNPLSKPAQRVSDSASKLGYQPFKLPIAINYFNTTRPLCIKCNTCDGHPCKIESKNDVTATLLRHAQNSGLKIVAGAIVNKVNEDNGAIKSVECVDKETGKIFVIEAKIVIISAGALQSSGILLRSGLEKYEHSRFVGRNLMRHGGSIIAGVFPFKTNPENVFHKQICVSSFYEDFRDETGYAAGTIQDIYTPAYQVLKYYAPVHLKPIARPVSRRLQNLICIAEDEPNSENRVTLSEEKDNFGINLLKIDHRFSKGDYDRLNHLIKHAKKILRKAGAFYFFVSEIDRNSPPTFSHAVGTVRFGKSSDESPLDENCKYFGIKNLFVLDGSFMPTSGGVNPSLTITANSLRVSDHIIRHFEQF